MKRFTLIVALVLMTVMSTFAERVTSETARKAATTFLNNNGAKATQLTDITQKVGFPNLYIFTADKGFVVMAADDCVQPILGYSLSDIFDSEDMPENLVWWLQGYNDEIQYAVENNLRATSETAKMWKDLAEGNSKAGKATMTVAPLIQTKWNQNKYYNDLCPAVSDGPNGHAYTGCVATAMAQIMKYWNYPSTGVGSHSYTWNGQTLSANFGATTYDWNNMADYYEYYFANGTDQYPNWLPEPSAEEIAAVATLMYHCGVSVDMIYGGNSTGGSAAYSNAPVNALINYFNYKPTIEYKQKSYTNLSTGYTTTYYTDSEWIAMLKVELDASRPLQYGGQDPNGNSGHAFVCDGYNSDDYFHFNWGWAGRYNGYFSLNNLDTGANSGEAGAGNGVYTRNQDAIFGIEPSSMVPAPTNLTYSLSGLNDITLTWNASNGASSYNVYRDSNLIGNTTNTTYSETAPFGTHSYYVRCVDANSQLSLPSNTITITIDYPTPIVNDLTATLSGNNASLTWTAPEWCAPSTDNEVLTYSYGNTIYSFGSGGNTKFYFGHKYPSSMINNNKVLYKVSFYAAMTGAFELHVYTARAGNSKPQTQVYMLNITVSDTGWNDIVLGNPIQLDASKDLWVFIYDPVGRTFPMGAGSFEGTDSNGNYYATNPTSYVYVDDDLVMLINTYITDGTYTYNLYDGTTSVATSISNTTYTVNNITNNTAHRYTLKTNFNGGLTEASNMAGLTIGNASLNSLTMAANDKMTITEGSKLTVTGTLSDENADNLILEDGAQLVNNSTGVLATVKKNISGYTQDGDWNLLASPFENVTPTVNNGLLANNYDLYTFDQSEAQEWRNIEAGAFNTIDNKTGYLYANSSNQTLSLEGTLVANTTATTLTYDNNATFKGFNLIGNPYPCNTYIDRSFYVLNEDGSNFTLGNNPIPPCSAILVQAQGSGESVTFNKNASKSGFNIAITVTEANTRSNAIVDQARVSFNEKDQLTKYTLSGQNGKLYIPQNGQDFAVAYANEESEMPINFKAAKSGTYTISIETEGLELGYLHLIDNLTGNDVDLLATPIYTFEAKTSDYATRFKLVFEYNGSSISSKAIK